MYYYSFLVQFAKANSPQFTTLTQLIDDAVDHYNAKSRIAANPKEIVEISIKDPITLQIILQSTNKLEVGMASKALRTWSSYLVNTNTPNNLSSYVIGKRIFKMIPSSLTSYKRQSKQCNKLSQSQSEPTQGLSSIPSKGDENILAKLDKIYSKLLELETKIDLKNTL